MRGMNMIQLLGGVAVAGAVAAGTTAFTANGMTKSGGLTATIGGTADVVAADLSGYTLSSLAATWDTTTAPAAPTVTGMTVTLSTTVGASTPVGLQVHDNNGYHVFSCTAISSGAASTTCTIAGFVPGVIDHIYVTV